MRESGKRNLSVYDADISIMNIILVLLFYVDVYAIFNVPYNQ